MSDDKKSDNSAEKTIQLEGDLWEADRPLPTRLHLYLKVTEGPESGRDIIIRNTRAVLGRTEGDVVIDDENMSRKHAVIEALSRDNILLKDLASTNGTFLNDRRVTQTKLCDGDVIGLGGTRLKFIVVAE